MLKAKNKTRDLITFLLFITLAFGLSFWFCSWSFYNDTGEEIKPTAFQVKEQKCEQDLKQIRDQYKKFKTKELRSQWAELEQFCNPEK